MVAATLLRRNRRRIKLSAPVADTAPSAFSAGQWTVTPGDGFATIAIVGLPNSGGQPIDNLFYQIDSGSLVAFGVTSPFDIVGLTNDQLYNLNIYAANSVGTSPISDTKPVTPTLTVTVPAPFTPAQWAPTTGSGPGEVDITILALPNDGGSPITDIQYQALPELSWTSLGVVTTGVQTVTLLLNDSPYDVQLRAVNAVGAGAASPVQSVTSGAEAPPIAAVLDNLVISFAPPVLRFDSDTIAGTIYARVRLFSDPSPTDAELIAGGGIYSTNAPVTLGAISLGLPDFSAQQDTQLYIDLLQNAGTAQNPLYSNRLGDEFTPVASIPVVTSNFFVDETGDRFVDEDGNPFVEEAA